MVRSIVGSELLWSNADSCSISTSQGDEISDEISMCNSRLSVRRSCTSSLTTIIKSKSLSLVAVPFARLPNRKTFFGFAILTMRSVICCRTGCVNITKDYTADRGRTQLNHQSTLVQHRITPGVFPAQSRKVGHVSQRSEVRESCGPLITIQVLHIYTASLPTRL